MPFRSLAHYIHSQVNKPPQQQQRNFRSLRWRRKKERRKYTRYGVGVEWRTSEGQVRQKVEKIRKPVSPSPSSLLSLSSPSLTRRADHLQSESELSSAAASSSSTAAAAAAAAFSSCGGGPRRRAALFLNSVENKRRRRLLSYPCTLLFSSVCVCVYNTHLGEKD